MTVGLCCTSKFNFVPAGRGRVTGAKCRLHSNHTYREILYSHMSLTFIVRAVNGDPESTVALWSTATITPNHEHQDSNKFKNISVIFK